MLNNLRESLLSLLSLEEVDDPDWAAIAEASDRALLAIIQAGYENLIHEDVYHYLEDYDVRMQSPTAARKQRRKLRRLIGSK
jgi:hypothetical protein